MDNRFVVGLRLNLAICQKYTTVSHIASRHRRSLTKGEAKSGYGFGVGPNSVQVFDRCFCKTCICGLSLPPTGSIAMT